MGRIGFLCVSLLLACGVARADKLVLLTESQPPFSMAAGERKFGRDQEVLGSSSDLLRGVCQRAAVDCQFILRFPWERVYQQALDGQASGIYPITRTHYRESYFKWVGPIASGEWVLLARSESPQRLSSLREASVYRVGGYRHHIVSRYLDEYGVPVHLTLEDQTNQERLEGGEIDFWATDSATARQASRRSRDKRPWASAPSSGRGSSRQKKRSTYGWASATSFTRSAKSCTPAWRA